MKTGDGSSSKRGIVAAVGGRVSGNPELLGAMLGSDLEAACAERVKARPWSSRIGGTERQARRVVGDKPWGEPERDDQVAFNGWSEAEISIGGEGGNPLFRSY